MEMPMFKRLLLIVTILVSCVGCDQMTKSIAKTHLPEMQPVSLLGGSVRLQVAKNYGAFLSLGESMNRSTRTAILVVGVAAVLLALFGYGVASAPRNSVVVPALGLVIGGGISNLIDRVLYAGYVFDFLNIGLGPVRTGIFNVADIFITSGVVLLVFSSQVSELLTKRSSGRSKDSRR
jgi:signal peptidase II